MIKILINLGMLENPQFAKGHLQKQIQMKLKDQCLLVKLKKKQRFFVLSPHLHNIILEVSGNVERNKKPPDMKETNLFFFTGNIMVCMENSKKTKTKFLELISD